MIVLVRATFKEILITVVDCRISYQCLLDVASNSRVASHVDSPTPNHNSFLSPVKAVR